jgi:hypothetical protein
MISLLSTLNPAVASAVGSGAQTAGDIAARTPILTGSLVHMVFAVAALAVIGSLCLLARAPYPSRKYRRMGALSGLRRALARISTFLP